MFLTRENGLSGRTGLFYGHVDKLFFNVLLIYIQNFRHFTIISVGYFVTEFKLKKHTVQNKIL